MRSRWSRGLLGVVLAVPSATAGCSSSSLDPGAGAGSATTVGTSPPVPTNVGTDPAPSGASASTVVSRSVVVTGKTITPPPTTVALAVGQTLEVTVTVDHDDELHAHEFGVEKAVKAGQPLTVTLAGTEPGVYEVELHHPELKLFEVAVR